MKFKANVFAMIVFSILVIFSGTACTQEKMQKAQASPNESKEVTLAQLAPFPVSVTYMESVTPAAKGKAADFTWTLDGKVVSFKEITKGKVVFMNFWGTWCGPCRREIPDLVEIANDLKDKDFIMIGVPQEKNPDNAKQVVIAFAESNKIPYLNVIDTKYDLGKAYGGINAVPTTLIIDKKGNVAETITGMRGKKEFMESINRVLK